jgi:molecular chaperone DnaJ
LKGRGVPSHGGHPAGDQYVVVKVCVPEKLDEHQKELVEKLAESLADDPRAKLEW